MRVLAATPLLALSAALTVPGNMNNDLTKRGNDIVAILSCNDVFVACAAACQGIQATHVQQACNSHCYHTWLWQVREADNDLPPGIDAPAVTRRQKLQGLTECNNEMVKCADTINSSLGDPTYANPLKWDDKLMLCGQLYNNCVENAGYTPDGKCTKS